MVSSIARPLTPGRRRLSITRDLGIDLGTANTIVYLKGKGIVAREPTVVAVDTASGQILAVGTAAREMLGRTPSRIRAIRPMQDGSIADFDLTRDMLRQIITKTVGRSPLIQPRVVMSTPYGSTQVEKRALSQAIRQAGAREVWLIEEPLAAAIGAALPVEEAVGNFIVNLGGGTAEIATIALGGVVYGITIRSAGDALNESLRQHLRREYRLNIGLRAAESAKITAGFACDADPDVEFIFKGMNLTTGMPDAVTLRAPEISTAMNETLAAIVAGVRTVFEHTPPQLITDIIEYGMTLTGGGALLKNLDRLLERALNLPVKIPPHPLDCVALGTGSIIQQMRQWQRLQVYYA